MITHPNCKINLGLNVVERRPDGYHNLETVFYPVPLCDELVLEESETDQIEVKGIPVDGDVFDNLVWRAVKMLRAAGHDIPPIRVVLTKNIPNGAGLGGGSSDAAFMIKMLNENFSLGLSVEEMERLAVTLGADCAVFIQNKPVFAEGIGNVFSPIELNLSGWFLVLVKPDDFISTREAYSAVTPCRPLYDLKDLVADSVETWNGRMVNDFEKSVFPLHPVVQGIRDRLYELGADYASMSGSGSSVFGLFRNPIDVGNEFSDHFLYTCVLP